MKDLDFDELDRAVSSLLGVEDEQTEQSSHTEVSEDSTVTPKDITPSITDADQPADADAPQKKPLIEKRPSGRFMDVVHPSSDMKNLQKPSVSRHTSMVTPLSLSDTAEEEGSKEEDKPVVPRDDNDEEVAVIDDNLHTLPDPLDFQSFSPDEDHTSGTSSEESVADAVSVDSAEDKDTPEDEDDNSHELELARVASELNELDGLMATEREQISVDTPFVNGLAVEKRPLGAFSIDTPDESLLSVKEEHIDDASQQREDDTTELTTPPEEPQDSLPRDNLDDVDAQTTPNAEVLPEELQDDIIAIESASVEPSTTAPVHAAASVGAGSITQQYAEKARPTVDTQTPVFDTTQYHQPLKHVAKQKSGWLNLLLIIIFVLVGVGAGAAMYFFDPFGLL